MIVLGQINKGFQQSFFRTKKHQKKLIVSLQQSPQPKQIIISLSSKMMIKKSVKPLSGSINQSKQTLKSAKKKPLPSNNTSHRSSIPAASNTQKKRTNSSLIQNSNKKKLQQVGYSHKKYKSNSSFKNNKHKIFEVEHVLPSSYGKKAFDKQSHPKTILSINKQSQNSMAKKKIRKNNFKNNQSVGEISYCKKVIVQKPKAMSSYEVKPKKVHERFEERKQNEESPVRKQDYIKTDFEERPMKQVNQHHNKEEISQEQKQPYQDENYQKLASIDIEQLKKLDKMTSKQVSQLQSRSQTIDLLKFTIKTKLQKDIASQSPHRLNSLISSSNKAPNQQYIEEILRLKQLETNFYVQKITALQNELNKFRKESEKHERQVIAKCQSENRKVLVEKTRLEEENHLLKRQNEALRTIIMKKIKNNNKTIHSTESHGISQSLDD